MLLFPNALCCSLYERNCVYAVTKIFMKFLPANNFCQLLRVTRKRSCTSAGNAQAQLHFRDDQQRAFGISNISNCRGTKQLNFPFICDLLLYFLVQSVRMVFMKMFYYQYCPRNNESMNSNIQL